MKANEHVTSRLVELRTQAGISQGTLSKISGLHVMKISKIERGVTKMENVTLRTAISLADALGIVDLRELLPEDPQLKDEYPKDQE